MLLSGFITDKNQAPIANAAVELKDEHFETVYQAFSDDAGHYQLDVPPGHYPFLTAVKDYAVHYLEYWCQDIPLIQPVSLDVILDRLEVYGLHVFPVKGAGNGLMAYFRPMSLDKYQRGEKDLAPEGISVTALVDGAPASVLQVNPVQEVCPDSKMAAYLIQIQTPSGAPSWSKCELRIQDSEGHCGAAAIFHSPL